MPASKCCICAALPSPATGATAHDYSGRSTSPRRAATAIPKILEAVAPAPGEVVLSKVSAGAFNGSELDSLLRRLRIDTLIVTGLVTGGCVEGTVRGAADRGYRVFLVEDACADWTVHQHAVSVSILGKWFATVIDSATAVAMIQGAAGADIDPPRSELSVPNRFAEAAPAGLQ